jgi:hypothetical protein
LWSGNNSAVKPYDFKVSIFWLLNKVNIWLFSVSLVHLLRVSMDMLNKMHR